MNVWHVVFFYVYVVVCGHRHCNVDITRPNFHIKCLRTRFIKLIDGYRGLLQLVVTHEKMPLFSSTNPHNENISANIAPAVWRLQSRRYSQEKCSKLFKSGEYLQLWGNFYQLVVELVGVWTSERHTTASSGIRYIKLWIYTSST